jgi:hypothetical protein
MFLVGMDDHSTGGVLRYAAFDIDAYKAEPTGGFLWQKASNDAT